VLLALPAQASPRGSRRSYWSLDHHLRAVVVYYNPRGYGTGESRVDIRDRRGRLVSSQDYSDGGTQGFAVNRGAWTPNSRYFVFTMQSAGGHQPWHFDTHFYSRRHRRFGDLEELLTAGAATDREQFRMRAPARVTVHTLAHGYRTVNLDRVPATRLREAWRQEQQLQAGLRRERP
jgi:hypothetical protein